MRSSNLAKFVVSSLVIVIVFVVSSYHVDNDKPFSDVLTQPQWTVLSSKGRISYNAIDQDVYRPMGYKVDGYEYPYAILKEMNKPSCAKIFEDWLQIAEKFDPKSVPPRAMSAEYVSDYLMQNYSFFHYWYLNNKHNAGRETKPYDWTESYIESLMSREPSTYVTYGKQGMAVYHALQHFKVKDFNGAVVGTIKPWCEAIALAAGAKHVTTVEYQKIIVGHPKMSYVHPIDQSKNYNEYLNKYDFVISFSSIEHSGLGRYGDIVDPIGDIREVQKIWCTLRPGGLFFLGLPFGRDTLTYNAHRIYGRIRLPLIFEGFELLAVFENDNPNSVQLSSESLERPDARSVTQAVFVLKKT